MRWQNDFGTPTPASSSRNFGTSIKRKRKLNLILALENKFLFQGIFILLLTLSIACATDNTSASNVTPIPDLPKPPQITQDTATHHHYSWLTESHFQNSLVNRIAPPLGYQHVPVEKGSYADWLRHLPLQEEGAPVLLYNGRLKGRQDVHAAVVDIDVGNKDLQQCADAVMRLRAEYLYSVKAFEQIHFDFTSGHEVSFDDWRRGRKPRVSGNQVTFSPMTDRTDDSYPNFKAYLQQIFNYAGTASLSKELQKVEIRDMQIGDVFILGGFPGHAVLVVDMAKSETGETVFLLAQSYMPAQNIHILRNHSDEDLSPWYPLDFGTILSTPEWEFTSDQLRRFAP